MWYRWKEIHRANISQEARNLCEQFGENVLSHAIAAGPIHGQQSGKLDWLIQSKREETLAWLIERRDIEERREDRLEALEIAILVFVVLGVVFDFILIAHGFPLSRE